MRVIFPDAARMTDIGYPKLAYVPFLISEDGSYPVEANRYIRERACLEWRPKLGSGDDRFRFNTRQTVKSLEAMSRRLMEFLLWCQNSKPSIDWRTVSYLDDLLDKWQVGMLDGTASRSHQKLCNETVNVRIAEACYFLTWAAERGFRKSFEVLVKVRSGVTSSANIKARHVGLSRVGELPSIRSSLSLPTEEALNRWQLMLRARYGEVMSLFAEFLIRTGVRISEGTGFRTTDFPEKIYGLEANAWREDWVVAGEIPCEICMGIKGPKISRGSERSVKPRKIYIPIDLADRLDHYRKEGRKTLFVRWISAGKDKAERASRKSMLRTDKFWIGKRGRPLTAGWIRQAWSGVSSRPWRWSPHKARHEFAVATIVNYTKSLIELSQLPSVPNVGWLHGLMAGQVQIILSPLLGHVDEKTTLIYLSAARERLLAEFTHPTLKWLGDCEE